MITFSQFGSFGIEKSLRTFALRECGIFVNQIVHVVEGSV